MNQTKNRKRKGRREEGPEFKKGSRKWKWEHHCQATAAYRKLSLAPVIIQQNLRKEEVRSSHPATKAKHSPAEWLLLRPVLSGPQG